MKYLAIILISFISVNSWSLPTLDPKKYTVCSMTMNSDNERRIFEEKIKESSNKFNPIVELTEFGAGDWFEKACASGIKCDQVVVSGHFASAWSGAKNKRLSLKTMEKAGCSNTCDGILDHPYEVFLFGCNTVATKAADDRTPEVYLDHLVEEGRARMAAEITTEERYGVSGDDNKTRFQRAFRGAYKQVYGFDARGPSGKTIESYLRKYFSGRPLEEKMEKVQATRFVGNIDALNKSPSSSAGYNHELAEALKVTAFDQCTAGADNEKDRKMCKLLSEKVSVSDKLDVVRSAFMSESWVKYLPTINDFFKANPVSKMTASQKAQVAELENNKVIKSRVKDLVKSTESLAIQMEWIKLSRSFNFMTKSEESKALEANINRMLTKGLSKSDADLFCALKSELQGRFALDPSKSVGEGVNTSRGKACILGAATPVAAPAPVRKPSLTREGLGLDKLKLEDR